MVQKAAKEYADSVTATNENWDKMTDIYYGPDRDMKNFPPIKMAEYHPKVRMGFIPDSWFQALYDKTGVTGRMHKLFHSYNTVHMFSVIFIKFNIVIPILNLIALI